MKLEECLKNQDPSFFPHHCLKKTASSLFSIHLSSSIFSTSIHLAFLITILLIAPGTELNPGPDNQTRSSTTDNTHDTSVAESLFKFSANQQY